MNDAFRRRDISCKLDMFTDDAAAHRPAQQVCSHGAVFTMVERGLQDFLDHSPNRLNPPHFELYEFIAQGYKIVVLGYQKGHANPTGRAYEIKFVHLWSVRHGKFSEFRIYNDTATHL
jgi:ketosteroid isomerase-like protein